MRFAVAFGVFAVTLAVTLILCLQNSRARKRMLILTIGTWLMLYVLMFPFGLATPYHVLRNLFLSAAQTLQVFSLNIDFIDETELANLPAWFARVYIIVTAFFYLAAPTITAGYLLRFLHGVRSWWQWLICRKKEVWFFSETSDKALLLARDALAHEDICAVFCGVKDDGARVREIGAIPFQDSIDLLNEDYFTKRCATVFFISDSEERNLEEALSFIEKHKRDARNTSGKRAQNASIFLYVFTSRPEAELLLNAVDKEGFTCRRIAENRAIVYAELRAANQAICSAAAAKETGGLKRLEFLLVGCGRIGFEMLKALIWMYGRDDCQLIIHVVDREDIRGRFARSCPGLAHLAVEGQLPPLGPEADVVVHFIQNTDIATYAIDETFADVDMVFVALGDDARNLESAIYLRQAFRRLKRQALPDRIDEDASFSLPEIHVAMSNPANKRLDFADISGKSYGIRPFAGSEGYDKVSTMLDYELEQLALVKHLAWGDNKELIERIRGKAIRTHLDWREIVLQTPDARAFYGYDYNSASSRASALFRLCYDRDEIDRRVEHKRWYQYMLTEGYQAPKPDPNGNIPPIKDTIAKLHYDIVPFEALSEQESDKDDRIARQGQAVPQPQKRRKS